MKYTFTGKGKNDNDYKYKGSIELDLSNIVSSESLPKRFLKQITSLKAFLQILH
ncbi:hypothetical protein EELLY_v1c00020 [Entomoplasma ellychniae]|uniref:Uncharacterized protein n=1 Tax=Entomoplasma ellychniae TaxID=2114 RepID=A0A8E2QY39_9MOLU|nr:hypothetical protein [Entomoplasma ellychniae]PPE04328.1 hypothetical protein EELLY_v1c00020 [Entomoplasma ellychniae]